MNKAEIKNRMEKLSAEIDRLRYEYHVLDKPEATDAVYDSLMDELRKLEEQYPELKSPASPTQRIGGKPLEKFEKVRHQIRQWSFDDVFDFEELRKWEEKIQRMLEKIEIKDTRSLSTKTTKRDQVSNSYQSSDAHPKLGFSLARPAPRDSQFIKTELFQKSLKPSFSGNIEYACEVKIDGLKIILTYENGILTRGATRGDGVIGEDVTENIKTIQSVPLKLNQHISLIAVGEVWLSKKELERINSERKKQGEALFANSRNAAAGSIRQLDSKVVASRKLDSFIYDLDYLDISPKLGFSPSSEADSSLKPSFSSFPATQIEELELLKKLGFNVNNDSKLCGNINEVEKFYQEWAKKKDKEDYGIDGVVVKINSKKIQDALGYTGKSPRWGVAYKFQAEKTTTVVEDIQVQVGRTGALTPVAHLKPTRVAGSVISRATLHNEDEINKLDIRIGDTVVIQKAGDVIPEVVEVIKNLRTGKEKKFQMPSRCPICGGEVKREITNYKSQNTNKSQSASWRTKHKTQNLDAHPKLGFSPSSEADSSLKPSFSTQPKESAAHYCLNPKCYAVERENIIHFVSKKGFNIDGLGEKIVENLINEGLISNFADIFELTKGDLEPLERFAEKSADNLIKAVEESKKIELEKFIFALGIRHVGEETAVLITKAINTEFPISNFQFPNPEGVPMEPYGASKFQIKKLSDVINIFPKITAEDWMSIKGIGDKSAESLSGWFNDEKNIELLERMEKLGVEIEMGLMGLKGKMGEKGKFQGKTFVLTGELKSWTRDEAKDIIRKAGGDVSSSVSKNTDYVVAGENPGSKYDKAKELGVKIIGEEEFRKMI